VSAAPMTPMQRTLTTLSQREPDRVPAFLLTTLHGARELGLSIREYFSCADHVVEGQLRLLRKFRGDCLYPFFHASIEFEAWGGESLFSDDGPPLAGAPVITRPADIDRLGAPPVAAAPGLQRVLAAIRALKARVGDDVPIIGVVISPFSLPVMQMGFDRYLDLIHEDPPRLERLLAANEAFAVEWGNAQLAAGATAICYFDPLASPTTLPRDVYLRTGHPLAARVLSRLQGPAATHLASGRCLPVLDDLVATGTAAVGVSTLEDLRVVKRAAAGRVSVIGNLNGVEMRRWTPAQAEHEVRRAIARAGRGGGFVLSDNHGEIPFQVPDDVLLAIGDALERWGRYPLDWVDGFADAESG